MVIFVIVDRNDRMLASRLVDRIADLLELVFCSRATADIVRIAYIPSLIIKARDIVTSLAFFGRNRLAIFTDTCNHIKRLVVEVLDDNRIIHRFRTILRVAADGQGTILLQVDIFIQSDLNRSGICISRNLNVAIFFCLLRSLVITTVAANLQGFVELLFNCLRNVITGKLQAITQGSHGLRSAAVLIGIDDTGDVLAVHTGFAILAIGPRLAFFRLDDGGAVSLLAISARNTIFAGQANGAFLAVFAIRGILAQNKFILRGNRNLAIGLGQGNILAGIDCHGIARMNQGLCIAGHVTFGR